MAATPVTILADRIPPFQWSLIEEALARCSHASVVAKDVPAQELSHAIGRHSPDVLILGSPETLRHAAVQDWLDGTGHKRRIIALQDGLRIMQLSEWRLVVKTLAGASIDTLCAAIEGRC